MPHTELNPSPHVTPLRALTGARRAGGARVPHERDARGRHVHPAHGHRPAHRVGREHDARVLQGHGLRHEARAERCPQAVHVDPAGRVVHHRGSWSGAQGALQATHAAQAAHAVLKLTLRVV